MLQSTNGLAHRWYSFFQRINIISFCLMSIFKRCWCSFLFLTLARGYEKHMPASDHTFWNTFLTRLDAQVPLELLECLIYGMLYTNLFGLSNGLVAIAHIKTSKDQRADVQHENNPPGSFRQFEHVWTKWRLVSHFAFLIPTWSISKLLITNFFQLRVQRQQSHGGFEWGRWKLKHESDFMFPYSYLSIWCLQKTCLYDYTDIFRGF